MWMLFALLLGTFLVFVLPLMLIDWPISAIITLVLYFMPLKIAWVRRWAIWRNLRTRLNYEVVDSTGRALPAVDGTQYVFAVAPHGPFCFSMMLTWIFDNPESPLVQRHRQTVPLVASQLLRLPLLGLLARLVGCEAITSDNYRWHLGRGHSIAMAPGGSKEVMYCDQDDATHLTLYRRRNNRWVEFALYNGTKIMPILSIGETSGFRVFRSVRWLQRFSYALVGWPFPMLNFGALFSFWPSRGHLKLVCGTPLDPTQYQSYELAADAYYTELERLAAAHGVTIQYER